MSQVIYSGTVFSILSETLRMANGNSQTAITKNAGAGANDSLLQELFLDSLKDIYYAEKAILKALPKMQQAATSQQLISAFEEHLAVTQGQVQRLEQVFEIIGEKVGSK